MSTQQLEYRRYLRVWRHKYVNTYEKNLVILERLAGWLFQVHGSVPVVSSRIDYFMSEFTGGNVC